MTAHILDGKSLAASIRSELQLKIKAGLDAGKLQPGLATILVGVDPASHIYVRNKRRACEEIGVENFHLELAEDIGQEGLLDQIEEYNQNPKVHGILIQLPLPKGYDYDESRVLESISASKDADGFHPLNQGALMQGRPAPQPCTPKAVMALLSKAGMDDLSGKKAVVVGRSNIVGKPVALMLLQRHATVTICHSRTPDLAQEVSQADVVVAAVGVPELVQGAWVKPGAVVIDVGINRNQEGKLVGDVEYSSAQKRAGAITPVPGGVGPMTIAMLLANTVEAAWGA